MTTSEELPPGSKIDRYVIDSVLGSGGMGTVYRARHAHMGNAVALKVLRPGAASDAHALDRFLNEAKASAMSGTPHIVRVLDFGLVDGSAFLVMELLEGRELWAMMRETGPLPIDRAVGIILQVLEGVGAAHAVGIVHRDLKPQNVFLARQPDGSEVAKLLDFGISKIIEGASVEHLTRTGVLLGTPMYMAPEQFLGSRAIDRRADLYSVCVMLYEMLSRSLPHEADTLSKLVVAVTSGTPIPLWEAQPSVPRALADVVHRGLERDPERRWQTAQDLAAALRSVTLGAAPTAPLGGAVAAPPPSGTAPTPSPAQPVSAQAAPLAQTHVAWTSGPPPSVPLAGATPFTQPIVAPARPVAAGAPPNAPASASSDTNNTLRNVLIIVALLLVLGCLGSCVGCYALQIAANSLPAQ